MRGQAQFTLPDMAMVLGTRAALGVGTGLLLADRFSSPERRRVVGQTLLLCGGFAAACLVSQLLGRPRTMTWTFGNGFDTGEAPRAREPMMMNRDAATAYGSYPRPR